MRSRFRLEEREPSSLIPNPANFRRHPDQQVRALRQSLDEFGHVAAPILNSRSGHLIDGHARVEIALADGEATIPVNVVDLSPAGERRLLRSLDRIGAMALIDESALDALIESIDDAALEALLGEVVEPVSGLLPEADPDAIPERVETRCKSGELWALGEHRLLCGDSTDLSQVERALDGAHAAIAFADPPYGAGNAEWDIDFQWEHDYLTALAPVVIVTPGIGAIHRFMNRTLMPYQWSIACNISNGHARGAVGFSNWIYAAVFSEGSVYRCDQDFLRIDLVVGEADGAHHRGQKPPRFMAWVCELFTEPGEVVLDPFAGSGTTLIACEQTGRVARCIEIEPRYCDVVLARYEACTGRDAERI
jgi:16S rRNA G966 N2-methylase RsmD